MNIIVQTTGGVAYYINGNIEIPNNTLDNISKELSSWNKITRKNFGALPISIPYVSPEEPITYCVAMFLTYSGIEQDLHTNTSKYGVWESTSSMDVLQ